MRLLALLGVALFMAGCSKAATLHGAEIIRWSDIRANSSEIEGRLVQVCGWFRAEFEVCALSSNPSSGAALVSSLDIWVVPKDTYCTLEQAVEHPARSWAVVTGVFRRGRGFGHLGQFELGIENAKVEVGDLPCDE